MIAKEGPSTPDAGLAAERAIGASESGLVRAFGTWVLAAGIVNITVGGGIFRLPTPVAASLGPAAPLAFVVCAAAMALIMVCIARAGRRVTVTGGPYAYVEVAFGRFVGFLSGLLLWLVGTLATAAVATIFVAAVGGLAPQLDGPGARRVVLTLTLVAFAALNVVGVRQGSRVNAILTVAKLAPLLLLVVIALPAVRPENLRWTALPAAAEVSRTSLLLIFAFAGVESALVPSGEVREPSRTIPYAIAIAMVGITLLYVALQVGAQGVLGSALAGSENPLADTAGGAAGEWARRLLLTGAVVSMFGYVGGMTLAIPRALFALARDGFLPRALASVHAKYRTPWVAILAQSAIVLVLAFTNGFEKLAILANVATLLLYAGCCLAAWKLDRDAAPGGGALGAGKRIVVPALALAVIAWLLASITLPEWRVVVAVMGAGCVVYLLRGRGRRAPGGLNRTLA